MSGELLTTLDAVDGFDAQVGTPKSKGDTTGALGSAGGLRKAGFECTKVESDLFRGSQLKDTHM